MGLTIQDQIVLGAISAEKAAREAAFDSLQKQINGLGTNVASFSAVLDQVAPFTDGSATFNAEAIVGQIALTQIQSGFALASDLTELSATVTGIGTSTAASIQTLQETIASETSSLAQVQTTITATVQNNLVQTNASIVQTATAAATATTALASVVTALTATVTSDVSTLTASITTEATTRASADTAIASTVTTLTATVSTNLTTVTGLISTEATTRATADSATSSLITSLSSAYGTQATVFTQGTTPTANNVGDIWNNSGVIKYWNGTTWTATFVASSLVSALISTTASTAASATAAVASSVTTLSATVATKNTVFNQTGTPTANAVGDVWNNTTTGDIKYWNGTTWTTTNVASASISAAVSTESSARATADGHLSSNYSVQVTAGNIVTGMQLNSSTGGGASSSTIAFMASTFEVSDGTSNYPVFSISGGIVTVATELDIGTSYGNTQIRASTGITNGGSNAFNVFTNAGNTTVTVGGGATGTGFTIFANNSSSLGLITCYNGGASTATIAAGGNASFQGLTANAAFLASSTAEIVGAMKLHGWVSGGGYTPIGGATVTGYFIMTDQSGSVHRLLTV